jgi:hypothetical protein
MNGEQKNSHWSRYLICFINLLAWFIIFIAGCNIESQPPRCEIIAIQKYTKSDINQVIEYIQSPEEDKTQKQGAKYEKFSQYCGDTIDFIKESYENRDQWRVVLILIEIILGWGITSVGMISCISAAIGASSSYMFSSHSSVLEGWWSNYLWGMIRGFIVYCLYLCGLLIFSEKAFKFLENFSVLEYVQLSASISLISFFVGFNSKILDNLLPDYLRLAKK